jgi:hypothetical protein
VSKFQSLRSKLRDRLVEAEQKQDTVSSVQESSGNNAANTNSRKEFSAAPETRTSRRQRSTRATATYRDEDEDDDDNALTKEQLEVSVTTPPAEQPRRTKKRLVSYRPLKKKQLQELCAKEGLHAVGSDKELIARHETFTNLYNSECDSFQPRSHQELLEEVRRREKARKDESMRVKFSGAREHSHCMEQLNKRRKEIGEAAAGAGGDGEAAIGAPTLTSGNPKFDLEVKTNFEKLIAQARQGMKKTKPSSDSSKEKGDQGGESIHGTDSAETPVAVDTYTHTSIDHTSNNIVAGADSKTIAINGLSPESSNSVNGTEAPASKLEDLVECNESSAKAAASIDLPEKLGVEPTAKRKATTTVQRPARSKQKAIAPLPSIDRNTTKNNDRPRRLSSSGNLIGPWECQACTFLNEKRTWSSASCEMCTAKRTPQPQPTGEENAVSIDC